jgi:hypothetical protein
VGAEFAAFFTIEDLLELLDVRYHANMLGCFKELSDSQSRQCRLSTAREFLQVAAFMCGPAYGAMTRARRKRVRR